MATRIQTQDIANAAVTAAKLAIPTTKGDILGYSTTPDRIPVGSDGQVLTADSSQTLGLKWAAAPSSSATTKGDLAGYSTTATRVPVGSDGYILVADSSQATGLKWVAYSSLSGIPRFSDSETPTGTVNGTNAAFTLANTPTTGSVHLYKNGLRQQPTTDYTISGATITFVTGNLPQTGDIVLADYRY